MVTAAQPLNYMKKVEYTYEVIEDEEFTEEELEELASLLAEMIYQYYLRKESERDEEIHNQP